MNTSASPARRTLSRRLMGSMGDPLVEGFSDADSVFDKGKIALVQCWPNVLGFWTHPEAGHRI